MAGVRLSAFAGTGFAGTTVFRCARGCREPRQVMPAREVAFIASLTGGRGSNRVRVTRAVEGTHFLGNGGRTATELRSRKGIATPFAAGMLWGNAPPGEDVVGHADPLRAACRLRRRKNTRNRWHDVADADNGGRLLTGVRSQA